MYVVVVDERSNAMNEGRFCGASLKESQPLLNWPYRIVSKPAQGYMVVDSVSLVEQALRD